LLQGERQHLTTTNTAATITIPQPTTAPSSSSSSTNNTGVTVLAAGNVPAAGCLSTSPSTGSVGSGIGADNGHTMADVAPFKRDSESPQPERPKRASLGQPPSADLLAISPLPSPSSRHGSIFAAADGLPAPNGFNDGIVEQTATESTAAMVAAAAASIEESQSTVDDSTADSKTQPRRKSAVKENKMFLRYLCKGAISFIASRVCSFNCASFSNFFDWGEESHFKWTTGEPSAASGVRRVAVFPCTSQWTTQPFIQQAKLSTGRRSSPSSNIMSFLHFLAIRNYFHLWK